ncbi:MAG: hypothetical protein MUO34_09120, partial [Ignavibacteriaceae bacterium]|nr:hypothetical protein [Ignavibacteriaceae bacterium]
MRLIFSALFLSITFIFSISAQEKTDTTKPSDQYHLRIADSLFYETDEVMVTGTRIQKKIIDIPYSVVRIS